MIIKKALTNQIEEIKDRVLRFTTSTETEDRDGDIIEVAGWELDNYMKNPVVLFGHNYRDLPIGKTIGIKVDTQGKKLIQDIQFATAGEYEFADTVYKLCKGGYLNTTSVGFDGKQVEPILDDKGYRVGTRFKRQELLETSVVPVPANPEALIEARSKGVISDNELSLMKGGKDMEQKRGATISEKNKKELESIHDAVKGCHERLRKLIDDNCSSEAMEEEEEKTYESITMEIKAELLQAIKELKASNSEEEPETKPTEEEPKEEPKEEPQEPKEGKSLENSEEPKEESDEIDLDSLEDPDDINISEEELEKALINLIEQKINQLKGGKTI